MGANAQTSVPTFTAGQVLTAAQLNQSARTGVPVAADAAARDGLFGGTGEKTLAEGQLVYLEDSDIVQYYDGSNWQTLAPSTSGLVYLTGTSVSAVTSFSLPNDTFTATYRNYRVIVEGVGSTATNQVNMRLRAAGADNTTSNYYSGLTSSDTTAVARLQGGNGAQSFVMGRTADSRMSYSFDVTAPQVAVNTTFSGTFAGELAGNLVYGSLGGMFNATTQFDALSIIFAAGTFTGTYRVYGYSES